MTTHGALTEPSRSYRVVTHDRKGREGNRKGREVGNPSIQPLGRREATSRWMAANAAIGGGQSCQ